MKSINITFAWRKIRHQAKDVAIPRYEKLFRSKKNILRKFFVDSFFLWLTFGHMVIKLCMQNKNLTFAVKKELRWKRTLI